jgi:pyruvate formate lyase activating enzyme
VPCKRSTPPPAALSLFSSLPVKGFLETSFVDWPGKLCAILFLGGCNFRCPYCHNHPLVLAPEGLETIPFATVMTRLTAREKWLDGICISGGEPALQPDLPALLAFLKKRGWAIKLDTNGSRPEVLENLIGAGLLDMVAMDVKAPLVQDMYDRCAGCAVDLGKIEKSIAILQRSGIVHEFRMTIVPALHTEESVLAWARRCSCPGHSRLRLQNFRPATTMSPLFAKERVFEPETFSRLQGVVAAFA